MTKDARIAAKLAEWAKNDLVEAREFAKNATPEQQRIARRMAREAKRRHAKANRRVGKALCRDWEDDAA